MKSGFDGPESFSKVPVVYALHLQVWHDKQVSLQVKKTL